MALLIVESPAKAKTIAKYLSHEFKVASSFGHVRDLPAKNSSVNPNDNFTMKYVIIEKAEKYVKELVKAANKEHDIYLATDPDREGEAIAWHIVETLRIKKAISKENNIYRIVFNEITKSAVQEAVKHPRKINMDLVNAQQARRALDYLVGFTLSPLLWRKLPGSKSAGRVQSVALRLICERETEIGKFISQEYWTIKVEMQSSQNVNFPALLSHYRDNKLDKFDIKNEQEAKDLIAQIVSRQYFIDKVESKQVKRNPLPPFITSSLQQDAANKLHFSVKNTMRIAQSLYEGVNIAGETVGLITYMRTDGFYIANEAIVSIRELIKVLYGDKYLPNSQRQYTKKVKNAQEAHEAIRPTDINRTPNNIAKYLTSDQLKLYEIIWKRTLASQMESVIIGQTVVRIPSTDLQIVLQARGSNIIFDGFYKVYLDNIAVENDDLLPILCEGESCKLISATPKQHFTQPPPRYSEASVVKKMEEVGIGRPSTYSTIISVLQDREYVTLENKRFIPSDRGKIVTIFLKKFFSRYVEYDFTAYMEEELDLISNGNADWKGVLGQFWLPFFDNILSVKQMEYNKILDGMRSLIIEDILSEKDRNDAENNVEKECSACSNGILKLSIGRRGIFLGCSNYPECNYTQEITKTDSKYPKSLGIDTITGQEVIIKHGPYGFYLQSGDTKKAITKDINIDDIDLNTATKLLSLPLILGVHPETKKEIKIGIGKFGYYIFYDAKYISLKKTYQEVFNLTLDNAIELITHNVQRSLGFDLQGKEIFFCNGKYGYYIKCGKINVPIGKNMDIDSIDLQQAIELIQNKNKK